MTLCLGVSLCELIFAPQRELVLALLATTQTADTDKIGKALFALFERFDLAPLDVVQVRFDRESISYFRRFLKMFFKCFL
jgi:hypothetical protein